MKNFLCLISKENFNNTSQWELLHYMNVNLKRDFCIVPYRNAVIMYKFTELEMKLHRLKIFTFVIEILAQL